MVDSTALIQGCESDTSQYSLTPLQHGMLFHALSNPGKGVDIEQIHFRLGETLDLVHFEDAWRTVVRRHDILRTRFSWTGQQDPTQIAEPDAELTIEQLDWSDLSEEQATQRFERFRHEDRLQDFAMDVAPLMRLRLIRFGRDDYRGLWTFHHALLDGRSFPLVLEEIFELYDGLLAGKACEPPQRRPFRDFVAFTRDQDLSEARVFWSDYLAGCEPSVQIDVVKPEPDPETPPFGAVELRLDAETTKQLRAFATDHGVTLNTLLQTSWALLNHHYSNKTDIVFGVTRACRHASVEGADSMLGLLINTVPMRVSIDPDADLATLLQTVRKHQVMVRAFETTPLPNIQEWSGVSAQTPLFESILVYDEQSLGSAMRRSDGEAWSNREFFYEGQTNYPLTVLAYGDAEFLLRLEFSTDRFDERSARRLIGQLGALLQSMLRKPDALAISLPYMADAEMRELADWNGTECDYDLETCLHFLFEEQVERTPDDIALAFEDTRLTYRELNQRANQLAHFLRRQMVAPDKIVGVLADRSIEMVVALYGIIKAGGAYLPLDPDYPADRLAFMVEDSAVQAILTQQHLVGRISGYEGEVLCLDTEWETIAEEPIVNPDHVNQPRDLAYVLYTSGSTGLPKGVMNEHRGIVNRLLWMQEAFGLTGADKVLQKTPFSFDVSVWEFFWPLLVGARLVVARPGGHKDGAYLVRTIQEADITTMHFVPSMLQFFAEEPHVEACKSLRRVICSGEALPRDLQDRLFARLDVELHNLYGPTEAAIDVTWWQCAADSRLNFIPIGKAIANTQIHVLDTHLRPVPVGVPGELHIGGVQVARGYLNRPELTAERFIRDPFSPASSDARLYKSGDLARFLDDGNVEYLGRLDHQVKLRGFRIELGEIEAVMSEHANVKECVVLAREDIPGDKRLVGYVVPGEAPVELDDLRQLLASKLAEHMVPSAFVVTEGFPLTPNGKIDRKALPPPASQSSSGMPNTPRSDVEERVAAIWCSILNLEAVDTHATFFDLGGHSLLVMRLANRLSDEFGRDVTVADIFRHSTVEGQAGFLKAPDEDGDDVKSFTDRRHKAAAQQMRRRGVRSRRSQTEARDHG